MQFRNPIPLATGQIDMEIEVRAGEWWPFTASADDSEAHGRALWQAAAELLGPEVLAAAKAAGGQENEASE